MAFGFNLAASQLSYPHKAGGDNPALFVEIESISEVFEGDEGRESDCSDIELTSEEHEALFEWLYDGLQDDFEYWRQAEG